MKVFLEIIQKPWLQVFFFGILLLIRYIYFSIENAFLDNLTNTMYYFPDSQDYLSVAKWIRFGNESVSLQKRPYMYPIWIALSESIVPSYALWFIQMFAWIGSGILIFKIMKQLTKNNLFSLLSLVLFARNISLITYTYFALTEILTAFFFCCGCIFA